MDVELAQIMRHSNSAVMYDEETYSSSFSPQWFSRTGERRQKRGAINWKDSSTIKTRWGE